MNKKNYIEKLLEAWENCPEYNFCEFIDLVWERLSNYSLRDIPDDLILVEAENFSKAEAIPYTFTVKGDFTAVVTVKARDKTEAEIKLCNKISEDLSNVGFDLENIEYDIFEGEK